MNPQLALLLLAQRGRQPRGLAAMPRGEDDNYTREWADRRRRLANTPGLGRMGREVPRRPFFNPGAVLDTSQIDDRESMIIDRSAPANPFAGGRRALQRGR